MDFQSIIHIVNKGKKDKAEHTRVTETNYHICLKRATVRISVCHAEATPPEFRKSVELRLLPKIKSSLNLKLR